MITCIRTISSHQDFQKLVILLDAYLAIMDGDDHSFYSQFNKSNQLKNALIVYKDGIPVGIGAYKEIDSKTVEIKRMFTLPEYRRNRIASKIVNELELWAKEEKYTNAVLETGINQVEAIGLYKKIGYQIIENYGQYQGVENSVCMKKSINQKSS